VLLSPGRRRADEDAVDPLEFVTRLPIPWLARCRVPHDLASVTCIGEEAPAREARTARGAVDRVWSAIEALYRSGVHPAIQVCIRRHGHVVLHRAIGHASGNAPDDPPDADKRPVTLDTPFTIFSASKAITGMVIHKLDEQRVLHLEDRVCDYIPEFGRRGKHRVTLRHVLSHRAGIPNLPPDSIDLDLLARPERVVQLLCDQQLSTRPGRWLAYHTVTGGFVLAEVVRRATGRDIRDVLRREITAPLGLEQLSFGVPPERIADVAVNAFTGPPPPPPIAQLLHRALGMGVREVVELSNDPRFLRGIVPSANVVATADDLSAFYQCLLDEGEWRGVRVFEPRTVRHATSEHSYWEIDFTLGVPLRYGLGFMLGGKNLSLFGPDNPNAFGHLGFSNTFSWADPDRDIAVAILTSGKPVVSLHVARVLQMLWAIAGAFPRSSRRAIAARRAEAPPAAAARSDAAG
jgi:CubicO group peptidase (beta-lactamase class C family)